MARRNRFNKSVSIVDPGVCPGIEGDIPASPADFATLVLDIPLDPASRTSSKLTRIAPS